MSWQIEVSGVSGQPGAERALKFPVTLRWLAGAPAFLANMKGQVRYNNEVVSRSLIAENLQFGGAIGADLQRDRLAFGTLVAPISAESIRWIEEQRGVADIVFRLEVEYAYHEVVQLASDGPVMAGRLYWATASGGHCRVSRSDWLRVLSELQWREYELIEVAMLPLTADVNLSEAFALVRRAQEAQRAGDYPDVLANCYKSLESAAKYHVQADDIKQGFAILLARALPESDEKQNLLDGLIGALRKYAHLGRHERYPALRITRAEAEFVLTTTIALFSLVSRSLARNTPT